MEIELVHLICIAFERSSMVLNESIHFSTLKRVLRYLCYDGNSHLGIIESPFHMNTSFVSYEITSTILLSLIDYYLHSF